MAWLPTPLRLLLVVALAAMPISASTLTSQDATCSAKNLVSCASSMPGDFCCPQKSSCLALAGNTTALCCPDGVTCDNIQPITCNITQQNPDRFPGAPVKTTVFDIALEKCGPDTCCPFGYSCSDGGKQCAKDRDQSKPPTDDTTSRPHSTSPATATSTAPASSTAPTQTSSSDPSSKSSNSDSKDKSGPDTTTIIGGVVGGLAAVLVIVVVAFICVRRRRHHNLANMEKAGYAGTATSSFGNIISDPILNQNSYRTDFILKPPSAAATPDTGRSRRSSAPFRRSVYPRISFGNPFNSPNPSSRASSAASDDDEEMRTGAVVGGRLAPIRSMKSSRNYSRRNPTTPRLQREPSSESINVFADPDTVERDPRDRLTRATTFSDMMDQADLHEVGHGRPYVPGTTPRI